jgi:two-component system, cell cycle response regulator
MSNHLVFISGFSPFETSSFTSFFRLASRRAISYQITQDIAQSALLIINADNEPILRSIIAKRPSQKVLLIGSSDKGTGWAFHQKPYTLMSLLSELDHLLEPDGLDTTFADTVQMPGMGANVNAPFLVNQMVLPPIPVTQQSPATRDTTYNPAAAPQKPKVEPIVPPSRAQYLDNSLQGQTTSGNAFDNILVVDDSDIALKFMQNRLDHFGYRAELARSGEEALAMIAKRKYRFVFMDVMMDGLDGYQTCRAIKQRKYSAGKPPMVIMLTSRGGTIDKIRGTLAGCDAYLTKPLKEVELIRILTKQDGLDGNTKFGQRNAADTQANLRNNTPAR